MIHLDLTFNISHPTAKKSILCLFVCFSKRFLYTSMAFLISTETKYSAIRHFRRGKLDQVNFRKGFWDCYWRQRGKAASHLRGTKPSCWRAKVALGQDKWRKYHIKLCVPFVCLDPVRLSLASMVVLYQVSCWLQRTYWPIADRRVPNNYPRNNCGTNFGSSSFLAFIK